MPGALSSPPTPAPASGRPVVVAGFSITALSVLRCLAGSPYDVWLVGCDARPGPARASRDHGRVVTYPANGDLVGFLRGLRARFEERPVLLLTEDAQTIAIARGYPEIERDYRILLPDPPTLEALGDKSQFTRLARDGGLPIPPTRILESPADLDALDVPYPYVLKPFLHHSQRIDDAAGLREYVAGLAPASLSSLIVQDWIPGGDDQLYFCFLLLGPDQELIASFLGRKLRQHPPGSGTTSFAVSWDDPELVRRTHEVLRGLGCHGYCSLEYKYDARTGEYLIMEPTVGRFNQQIALTMAAGVNFPRLVADQGYGLALSERVPTRRAFWIYEFGDLASLWRTGGVRRFPRALRRADVRVLLSWRDPLPFLAKLATVVRSRVAL